MKKTLIALAVIATLFAALGTAGYAYAQSTTSTTTANAAMLAQHYQMMANGGMNGEGMMHRGGQGFNPAGNTLHTYMQAALAEAFGLTAEELQARFDAGDRPEDLAVEKGLTLTEFDALMDAARADALAAAVEAGDLTQEEADAFLAAEPGQKGGRGMDMHNDGDNPLHTYMIASLAEGLGLSAEDLQTRLDAGETVRDIAAAEGLTVEAFETLKDAAHTAALAAAVADGAITQEQADWMQQRHAEGGQGFGPGGHGGGHHGGGQGGGRHGNPGMMNPGMMNPGFGPNQTPSNITPSSTDGQS